MQKSKFGKGLHNFSSYFSFIDTLEDVSRRTNLGAAEVDVYRELLCTEEEYSLKVGLIGSFPDII